MSVSRTKKVVTSLSTAHCSPVITLCSVCCYVINKSSDGPCGLYGHTGGTLNPSSASVSTCPSFAESSSPQTEAIGDTVTLQYEWDMWLWRVEWYSV